MSAHAYGFNCNFSFRGRDVHCEWRAAFRSGPEKSSRRDSAEPGPVLIGLRLAGADGILPSPILNYGAVRLQPAGRVGPNAAPITTLLFIYTIAVWRVLAR